MKAIGIKMVELQPMRASVELNQFINTWNPYVEPKEEIKDEVGEEIHV